MNAAERDISERTHAADSRPAPTEDPMVQVTLTDRYDNYLFGTTQFNAGESLSVPSREADRLVREGAAVRLPVPDDQSLPQGKSVVHPPKDKMVNHAATK